MCCTSYTRSSRQRFTSIPVSCIVTESDPDWIVLDNESDNIFASSDQEGVKVKSEQPSATSTASEAPFQRFRDLTEAQLDEIACATQCENTKQTTKWAVKVVKGNCEVY